MSEIDPDIERLLGKHLLQEATAAEAAELRKAAEGSPRVAEALALLEASAGAFGDSSLAQPTKDPELEALLADPARAGEALAGHLAKERAGKRRNLILSLVFAGIVLRDASLKGFGLATLFDPAWWWIHALFGLGAVHQGLHAWRARRRREGIAAGGADWDSLVAAAREPLGWWTLLGALLPCLALASLGFAIGWPDSPILLAGLHEGWRQSIGLGLGYLSTLSLWSLHPHVEAALLRAQAGAKQ